MPPGLSDAALLLRRKMWLMLALGVGGLVLVWAALREQVPPALGVIGALLAAVCFSTGVMFGLRGHRQALADRDAVSRRSMVVLIASALARQTDEALTAIAGRGGPAAEAARQVLEGRRGGRTQT